MTIRLTRSEVEEQFQEADEKELQFDPTDKLDTTLKFNAPFAQGWIREIILREGIHLEINQIQNKDRVIISLPESEGHDIGCLFLLSGNHQVTVASASTKTWTETGGGYRLNSTGSRGQYVADFDLKPWSIIRFDIHQSVFRSFIASPDGELPQHLQYLVKPISQEIQRRVRDTQPIMNTVLQQILHCPYQGMVKRAYLESKVIELMALVLDHERAIQQGETKKIFLKPEQIEQIYYAKEILLRDLNNPPSLAELAQQVGLNDYLLKKGFHQVFGTSVFGELQAYRLDFAKQLLAKQKVSITEISRLVGYANRNSFSRAFKDKFGFSPIDYRKSCR